MKHRFDVPCASDYCLCARNGCAQETREIHALLEYQVGKEKEKKELLVRLPVGFHLGQIKAALACATRQLLNRNETSYGWLTFRLDGKDKQRSFGEWLKDLWYRISWRGRPVTASHFVPIWPAPPPRPGK